jgi:hypothetical protein
MLDIDGTFTNVPYLDKIFVLSDRGILQLRAAVMKPVKMSVLLLSTVGYFEKQRQEHKLGLLLLAVSVLFIVCQSFKMVPDLYEILFCSDKSQLCDMTPFVETCLSLSHLLVV